MFDIGFFELCVIGIVALLVLGPERLPRAARTAGLWIGRAKRMVSQVKRDIDNEIRREELEGLDELREARETLSKTRESMNSFKEDLNKQVDAGAEEKEKKKPETVSPSSGADAPESADSTTDTTTNQSATGKSDESR